MKYLIALFTFFTAFHVAQACNISLYSRIYVVHANNMTAKDVIKASDCNNSNNSKIFSFLKEGRGVITAQMLQEQVPEESIIISPSKVVIEDIQGFLERSLNFPSDKKIIDINLVTGSSTISLGDNQFISSSCSDCSKPGQSTARVNITNAIENTNTTQWINVHIGVKAHVFKATANIPAFTKIEDNGLLEEEDIFTSNPSKYASRLSDLKYRQIVRPVQKGQPIELTATMPYAVVKSGETIKVITSNSNISIETSGVCLEQGQINQLIRIRNINTNKIFTAKVIDRNTARIDL